MAYRQSRSEGFTHVDGLHRHGYSPRTPPARTIEQFLREEDGMGYSAHTSPTFGRHNNDMEDDNFSPTRKKSVIARAKERARKWRSTFSKKKHPQEDSYSTPSWGVSLDDEDEEEDEDPEYFGAPMYESEMAPEEIKETARQHPRAVPVIPENHVLGSSSRNRNEAGAEIQEVQQKETSPKTITQSVTEKLAPAYAAASAAAYDASHAIAAKVHSLTLSTPEAPVSEESSAVPNQALVAPTPAANGQQTSSGGQVWDKGVSVKEYLKHKFEPGEDEKALSQVISEAISPRKENAGEVGMADKLKGAVTSFQRNEDSNSNQPTANHPAVNQPVVKRPNVYHSARNSASDIAVTTNSLEVVDEESNGRILQAN